MDIQVLHLAGSLTPVAESAKAAQGSAVLTSERIAPAAGTGTANFVDNRGPVLTNASLVVIFWGSAWQAGTTSPTAQNVANGVVNILSGTYMSALSQYRGIGQATISTGGVLPGPEPPSPFDPASVQNVINSLISANQVPAPASNNQLLYVVFLPSGVNPGAAHGFFTYSDGSKAHYAFIGNNGDLNMVTTLFSAVLVGSCTDPEGTGFQGAPGTCGQSQGWCEIEMVCQQAVVVNGVSVAQYWSQKDQTCVAPGS